MDEFSDEILTEILLRLPVLSLIRFKSVSRRWHSLISNPHFLRYQLQRAMSRKPYYSTAVLLNGNPLESISVEPLCDPIVEAPPTTVLQLPVKISCWEVVDIVGSCDGLVCLRIGTKSSSYFLLNPTTRECRELARPSSVHPYCLFFHGLGYDPRTHDYKLVRGRCATNTPKPCRSQEVDRLGGRPNSDHTGIEIFSLGKNSWSCLSERIEFRSPSIGVYASGCLHWLMRRSDSEPIAKIVSFNLSEEKFHETVPMTGINDLECVDLKGLVVSGECMFVSRVLRSHLEAWMMKLDGKETSWTKSCSISMDDLPLDGNHRLHPIAYTSDGKIIFDSSDGALCLYDSKENAVRMFKLLLKMELVRSATYVESLVSPHADTRFTPMSIPKALEASRGYEMV